MAHFFLKTLHLFNWSSILLLLRISKLHLIIITIIFHLYPSYTFRPLQGHHYGDIHKSTRVQQILCETCVCGQYRIHLLTRTTWAEFAELVRLFTYTALLMSGPGWLSRYSDSLRTGRSGDRIPVGASFSAPIQTGLGAHPASCKTGTGSFPWVKAAEA